MKLFPEPLTWTYPFGRFLRYPNHLIWGYNSHFANL